MQCKSSRFDQHLPSADLKSIPSISGREDAPRFFTDPVNRRVYMDHVSFFVYLTDVEEGDGGVRRCATFRLSPRQPSPPETLAQMQFRPCRTKARRGLG